MTANKQLKKPPSRTIASIQHDLFAQFLTNNENNVSNTIEYWERIPKYFISANQQKKLRTSDGLAQSYSYEYTLKDKKGHSLPYKVKIQPALIEQANGKDKAFFPTKAEETIEEVLKKIFTEQQYAIHDSNNVESWVKFSYGMIRKELKNKKCERTYSEIKHNLEVMSKCILTVYENDKEIYTGSILQDYCSVNREQYLDNSKALHMARFPIFISHAVNTLQYRQYNYLRFMECKEQLTRFIYKRLIDRFINANCMNDYHFLYSDIKQASGLLQQKFLGWQIFITIAISIFVLLCQKYYFISPLSAVLLVIYDVLVTHHIKNIKIKAAKIQELFDCNVLSLEWDEIISEDKPSIEDIKLISKSYEDRESILNWYPDEVKEVDIHIGRILCQRSNLWWDVSQKENFYKCIVSILTFFIFFFSPI